MLDSRAAKKQNTVCNSAYDEISVCESQYCMPNQELESALGIDFCAIEYCPEDWLGSVQAHSDQAIVKKCDFFTTGKKCQKCTECNVKQANHKYFDALDELQKAKTQRTNSWNAVLGKIK